MSIINRNQLVYRPSDIIRHLYQSPYNQVAFPWSFGLWLSSLVGQIPVHCSSVIWLIVTVHDKHFLDLFCEIVQYLPVFYRYKVLSIQELSWFVLWEIGHSNHLTRIGIDALVAALAALTILVAMRRNVRVNGHWTEAFSKNTNAVLEQRNWVKALATHPILQNK